MQFVNIEVSVAEIETALGQVADETAGEAIARAGRIKDIFQQITRDHEKRIAPEEHRAIFAALDDQRVRAEIENLLGRLA